MGHERERERERDKATRINMSATRIAELRSLLANELEQCMAPTRGVQSGHRVSRALACALVVFVVFCLATITFRGGAGYLTAPTLADEDPLFQPF